MSIDKVVQNRLHDLKLEHEIGQRKIRFVGEVAKQYYGLVDELVSVQGFNDSKADQVKASSFYSIIENVLEGDYINKMSNEKYSEPFIKMNLTKYEVTPDFISLTADQDYVKFAVALGWAEWVPSSGLVNSQKAEEKHSLTGLLRVVFCEHKYSIKPTQLGEKIMKDYSALEE